MGEKSCDNASARELGGHRIEPLGTIQLDVANARRRKSDTESLVLLHATLDHDTVGHTRSDNESWRKLEKVPREPPAAGGFESAGIRMRRSSCQTDTHLTFEIERTQPCSRNGTFIHFAFAQDLFK
jgi:hypothetical protein